VRELNASLAKFVCLLEGAIITDAAIIIALTAIVAIVITVRE